MTTEPPETSDSESTTIEPGTTTIEPGTSGLPGECLIGNVTIDGVNTEAKIAALAGIECITGGLLFENVDRADMQGLESLRHMDVLEIRWSSFTSLAGLENLESVRALSVWQNPGLADIGALANLEIEGILDLREIPITSLPFAGLVHLDNTLLIRDTKLTSLAGLDALESVGSLRIQENKQLTSLAGLDKLTSVSDVVYIEANPGLVDVAGLGALASVGEEFEVYGNDALVSLSGLTLSSVGQLNITSNAKLKSLAGLENLGQAQGVRIQLNPALTSVAALRPDGVLVTSALTIRDNGALPTCGARAVADAQLALEFLCIHNNKLDACSGDPGLCLAP